MLGNALLSPSKDGGQGANPRLPTMFVPREQSICISQDSMYYNNDGARGDTVTPNAEFETSHVIYQS